MNKETIKLSKITVLDPLVESGDVEYLVKLEWNNEEKWETKTITQQS